jgi:hypothetical protein
MFPRVSLIYWQAASPVFMQDVLHHVKDQGTANESAPDSRLTFEDVHEQDPVFCVHRAFKVLQRLPFFLR